MDYEPERWREERCALVDHERADVDELTLDSAILDLGVLLVEVRHELGAVVTAVALSGEDEPTGNMIKSRLKMINQDTYSLL